VRAAAEPLWLCSLVGWACWGLAGPVAVYGFLPGPTQPVGSGWLSLGSGVGVLAGAPVAIVAAITVIGIPAFAEVARAVFGCELRGEKFGLASSRGGHLESPLSFCCFLRSVIYLVFASPIPVGASIPFSAQGDRFTLTCRDLAGHIG
jgi:hypothetical protein